MITKTSIFVYSCLMPCLPHQILWWMPAIKPKTEISQIARNNLLESQAYISDRPHKGFLLWGNKSRAYFSKYYKKCTSLNWLALGALCIQSNINSSWCDILIVSFRWHVLHVVVQIFQFQLFRYFWRKSLPVSP